MRKQLGLLRMGCSWAFFACVAGSLQAAPVVLKFATLAPEGSPWMNAFEKVKQDVQAATAGEVQIKVYPAGILGEEKDVLFKTKMGQVDGGGFIGFGIGKICPDARALMFPLTFSEYEQVDKVLGKMRPYLDQKCLENGYVALGWTEIGFSYLMSTVPVRTLQDLRGAKPWTTPDAEMINELFAAGKVSAIPVSVGDVLTSLQTGLLQSIFSPPAAAVALQWHTKVKYRNAMRLAYTLGGVFVAERAWNRVPEKHRPVIMGIVEKYTRELATQVRQSNEEALKVMEQHHIATLESSPADIAEFHRINAEALKNIEGRVFSAEAYRMVREYLQAEERAP